MLRTVHCSQQSFVVGAFILSMYKGAGMEGHNFLKVKRVAKCWGHDLNLLCDLGIQVINHRRVIRWIQ